MEWGGESLTKNFQLTIFMLVLTSSKHALWPYHKLCKITSVIQRYIYALLVVDKMCTSIVLHVKGVELLKIQGITSTCMHSYVVEPWIASQMLTYVLTQARCGIANTVA